MANQAWIDAVVVNPVYEAEVRATVDLVSVNPVYEAQTKARVDSIVVCVVWEEASSTGGGDVGMMLLLGP